MKQLVLSGNRILAHGEDCFLSMGGKVICTQTAREFENATVAQITGEIPFDIDKAGYEYHAGEFRPCAPFGKDESGEGTLMVACKSCKTPRDSGIPVKNLPNIAESGLIFNCLPNIELPESASPSGYGGLTYGNGRFIALDLYGGAYSNDGETWERFTLPTTGTHPIAYGAGKFVVILQKEGTNSAAYSVDGVTWTATTLPENAEWFLICYGNGMFVAISREKDTAYSTDGVTWTKGVDVTWTIPYGSNTSASLVYGNGMFVAVSRDGQCSCSTDGINWTAGNKISNDGVVSVRGYGNGLFISANSGNEEYYSADPLTTQWAKKTVSVNLGLIYYYNEMFVSVGAYSTDGINWTATTIPEGYTLLGSLAYDGSRFLTVGGTKALDSINGKEWRVRGSYRLRLCDGTDVTEEVKTVLGI